MSDDLSGGRGTAGVRDRLLSADRKDAPPVAQYRDVSIDRGEMDRLADRCNRGQLDLLQLEDVILDAIL